MNTSKTIVFITGAFVSHTIWDSWKTYFSGYGYTTLAPAWPFKDAPVQELRETLPGNKDFASLTLNDIIAHYTTIIENLPEKPIIIGHSIGGLITQILVNKNLAAVGVAIHSVPPKGVFSFEWSFIKSMITPLGLPFSKKVYQMSLKEWDYTFTNGLDTAIQEKAYEKYCIPESRLVLRNVLSDMARVDFDKPHPPLLIITGTTDRIVPSSLVYENYIRYNKNHSVPAYKEFKDRNHFVLAQPGWEEQAEYIKSWLEIISFN